MQTKPWTAALVSAALCLCAPVQAHFISSQSLDLTRVLGGPPAPASEGQRSDLQAVLRAQAARTPAQIAAAQDPNDLTVFQFADVLGPAFAQSRLPLATAFFDKVREDALDALAPAKNRWKRPRPFLVSSEVHPAGEKPGSASYPSGNALLGYVYAVLLADILPERRDAIFAKGIDIGDARVVNGVHYPSDLAAGRLAATAVVTALPNAPGYAAELAAAREEIRAALLPK